MSLSKKKNDKSRSSETVHEAGFMLAHTWNVIQVIDKQRNVFTDSATKTLESSISKCIS